MADSLEKRAVIYARVSTARQAEEELPIDSQLARCRSKALDLDASIIREFVDAGLTGTSADSRPAFQACIEFCTAILPDYLIVWSTSRFARNRIDAALYKRDLDRVGVDLVYVSTPINRKDSSGFLTEGILELFDDYWSRQIAKDTSRSMILNAKNGYWNGGNPPFGYQTVPAPGNPKRKKLEPFDPEAILVLDVFRLRIKGLGAAAIAAEMNRQGLTYRHRKWNRTTTLHLLRNEAVIGKIIFGRKDGRTQHIRPREQWIVVDSHDPIVPLELWNQVQEVLNRAAANTRPDSKAGSPDSTHLFTGLLRCSETDCSYQIETAKGRSKRYSYYNRRDYQAKRSGKLRRIRADLFDEWMLGIILDRILTKEFLSDVIRDLQSAVGEWAKDHKRRRAAAVSNIEAITTKNNKLFDILEQFGRDAPNLGDLTKRLRANNKDLKYWEEQLLAIDAEEPPSVDVSSADVDELSESLRYIIESTDDPAKVRRFLGSFIDRILIGDATVRIEYRPEALVANPEPVAVPSGVNWLPVLCLLGTKTTLDVELPRRFHYRAA